MLILDKIWNRIAVGYQQKRGEQVLTPEYLLNISEGAEEIAEYLHADIMNRIIERIMIRLNRGEEYLLTSQDKWQFEVLQEAGYLLEDIQKEIEKRTGEQAQEIAEAFEDAGVKNLEWDDKIYRAAGLSPVPLWESPYMIRLMQRSYEATMGEWKNFTQTTAKKAQSDFIQALDEMYIKVTSGVVSYSQGFLECIEKIAEKGVTVDFPRRTDTIETAALRCVRTGISQMSGQITSERMKEMDWDIVLVSSHLGARVTKENNYTNHSWWQGQFYSLSGTDSRFPPYSVCGEGEVQGIHGANCRHSKGPGDGVHNPFDDYDSEENLKAYEIQQRQRLLERRIRKTKRETMNLKTAVDHCKDEKVKFELDMSYQRKAALLQKQNQAYKDYCKENNLKELHERIAIARWDRRQAAAARGAAQRYNNARSD